MQRTEGITMGVLSRLTRALVGVVLVLAALFLHEPLTLRTGLGGLLIVAGALVLAWK